MGRPGPSAKAAPAGRPKVAEYEMKAERAGRGVGGNEKKELVRAKGREKVQRGESLKEEEGKEVRAAEGAGPFSTGTSGMRAPPARMRRDNPR